MDNANGERATKKSKNNEKRKREQNKARVQKHRAEMSIEKLEEKRRKDRERYQKKKEQGLIKPISQCSKREKKLKRKSWKETTARYREKIKTQQRETRFLENATPPQSDREDNARTPSPQLIQIKLPSTKQLSGRRRINKDRSKVYRKLRKAEHKIASLTKTVERYRKKIYRTKIKNITQKDSPNTKVEQLVKGIHVTENIRRKLLFGETIKAELRQNSQKAKDSRDKQIIAKVISGPIMKKYRLIGETKDVVSYKMHKKQRDKLNLKQYDRKQRNDRISKCFQKQIQTFLERDDNSKMCPGKKDFRRKGKVIKQKRLLQDSLLELHKKFLKDDSHYKISYASFRRYRPFWIVSPKASDRETCACVKHANINLLVKKLFVHQLLDTFYISELIKTTVCNAEDKNCMFGICSICKNKKCKVQLHKCADINKMVTYQQWENIVEERTIRNKIQKVKRTVKVEKQCTIINLFQKLNLQLISFKKHIFIMRHQIKQMQDKKKSLAAHEIIIQIDFSENYVAKYSNEIQAVHFGASKKQISLHTGLYYYYDDKTGAIKNQSFCTVSDNADHQAFAVWAHLEPVLIELSSKFPKVDTLHFFSDGPSSQYKNRFNLYFLMTKIPIFFNNISNVTWNYSESGHGKGPMDGVGGTLKRKADAIVLRGEDIISASDFVGKLRHGAIQLWEVCDEEIKKMKSELPKKLSPVNGIMSMHQVLWSKHNNKDNLQLRQLSCFTCTSEECCHFPMKPYVNMTHQDCAKSILLLY